jgi:hypothetical protein
MSNPLPSVVPVLQLKAKALLSYVPTSVIASPVTLESSVFAVDPIRTKALLSSARVVPENHRYNRERQHIEVIDATSTW